jgi:hypothetical protein
MLTFTRPTLWIALVTLTSLFNQARGEFGQFDNGPVYQGPIYRQGPVVGEPVRQVVTPPTTPSRIYDLPPLKDPKEKGLVALPIPQATKLSFGLTVGGHPIDAASGTEKGWVDYMTQVLSASELPAGIQKKDETLFLVPAAEGTPPIQVKVFFYYAINQNGVETNVFADPNVLPFKQIYSNLDNNFRVLVNRKANRPAVAKREAPKSAAPAQEPVPTAAPGGDVATPRDSRPAEMKPAPGPAPTPAEPKIGDMPEEPQALKLQPPPRPKIPMIESLENGAKKGLDAKPAMSEPEKPKAAKVETTPAIPRPEVKPEPPKPPPPPPARAFLTVPKLREGNKKGLVDLTSFGIGNLRVSVVIDGVPVPDFNKEPELEKKVLAFLGGSDVADFSLGRDYQVRRNGKKIVFRFVMVDAETAPLEKATEVPGEHILHLRNASTSNFYEVLVARRDKTKRGDVRAESIRFCPTAREFVQDETNKKKFEDLMGFLHKWHEPLWKKLDSLLDQTCIYLHVDVARFSPSVAVNLTDFIGPGKQRSNHFAAEKMPKLDPARKAEFTLIALLEKVLPRHYEEAWRSTQAVWFVSAIYPWTGENNGVAKDSELTKTQFLAIEKNFTKSQATDSIFKLRHELEAARFRAMRLLNPDDREAAGNELSALIRLSNEWAQESLDRDYALAFDNTPEADEQFELRRKLFFLVRGLDLSEIPDEVFEGRFQVALKAGAKLDAGNITENDVRALATLVSAPQ